jgi:hypothetical protein
MLEIEEAAVSILGADVTAIYVGGSVVNLFYVCVFRFPDILISRF